MRAPMRAPGPTALAGRYRNPSVRPQWYRKRQAGMTPRQRRAEASLWPVLGLAWAHGAPIALDAAFGQAAPAAPPPTRVLEIGCGGGEALATLAAARPDAQFVGVDWYRAGLAAALIRLDDAGARNARLVRGDAATVLATGLPASPLFDEALIYFPDPWHSSPERRIVRADVLTQLSTRMRPGGWIRIATDVDGYADDARRVVRAHGGWAERPCAELEAMRPGHCRPSTRYEREAIAAGRDVCDVCFELVDVGDRGDDAACCR